METRCIDLFHLTDQPVFKSLRQGLFSEDLPAQIRDLILSIHEVTSPGSPYKHCALELLICADISLAMFKSQEELASANKTIAEAIDRIHRYVLLKLGELDNTLGYAAPKGEPMIKSQLTWTKDKSRFAQFCHMIKVGKLVESHETLDDVVQKMAQVFGVDITTQYARNRISSLKFIDSDKSMTPLIDELKEAVTTQINEQLEKTA